ncbi:MAG: hypothetical protein CBD26_03475 [Candidatus Pelagibacter sp. TMED166]|nr:MAG: hypothetical protein CBD26_03475 [Candidatus Pelagibacter sp. TMED166]
MILGLDISTSITGVTVIDENGNCLYNEMWDTRNKKHFPNLYRKARFIKNKLLDVDDGFCIEKIYIEQSLQSFRSGFSSAKTLSTLSRFNGIVSWLCVETFEIEPEMIAASSARKKVGVKIQKGEKAKEKSFQFVLANEPSFVVEYTKNGNPKPGTMDKSDSWIIAKAGYINWKTKS